MKLYYAPGACSLADRIALHEAKIAAEFEKVDLRSKTTETGVDFTVVNPKGYVPLLVLNDGESVTENIAVLSWIASQAPELVPAGSLGATRLLEALAFISTEIHKAFKPFYTRDASDAEKARAGTVITRRLEILAAGFTGPYLLGSRFTVADAYLFVMLTWTCKFGVSVPDVLALYFERVKARDSVRRALAEEGLTEAREPSLAQA